MGFKWVKKPKKTRTKKTTKSINQETEQTIKTSLKFSQHIAQWSKFLTFIFTIVYLTTFFVYLAISVHSYIITGIFLMDIQDFVLQPTLIVVGFYFGTKVFENISEGLCNAYMTKKFEMNIKNDYNTNDCENDA